MANSESLVGREQITVSTVVKTLTLPRGAAFAVLFLEGASVRWTDEGTAPVGATTGNKLDAGDYLIYPGQLGKLKFIRDAGTNGTLHVNYYSGYTGVEVPYVVKGSLTATVSGSDIQLGAVEIKDGNSDARAEVSPAGAVMTEPQRPATPTSANVAASASSVTLLAANTARLGATIVNESASILYVKFGSAASATSYWVQMAPTTNGNHAYYEVPFFYTGIITGIWASATGSARVGELAA